MKRMRLLNLIPLITTMPAVIIGVIAMLYNEISAVIWIQNMVFLIVLGLISSFILLHRFNIEDNKFNSLYIIIPLLLLILTFIYPGLDGVHRWIAIGPVRINISMVVLPIIMVVLWELLNARGLWVAATLVLIICILLFIQPDASQLTSFAVPMMIMLCSKTNKNIFRLMITGVGLVFIVVSWLFLDSLPPVSYVEGIVGLVASMGYIWLILGVLALVILPIPFLLFPPRNFRLVSVCIGLYYSFVLLSTLIGNFPVPLMGYGISPILGYFISITWYTKAKIGP